MRTITEYLNSSNSNEFMLFESINTEMSLQEVYESLFDKMFNEDMQLNEGLGDWLRKLAGKGDKIDAKAKELKDAAKAKIDKISDAAKNAIEAAKQKVGDAWDSVKDTYTSAVATIDDAIQNAKASVEDMVTKAGIKMEAFVATAGQVMSNMYAQGKEKLANSFKDTKKAAAFNALLLGAILCKNNGIDSSQMLDILSAAGVK